MNAPSLPAPGWYLDGQGSHRWWDGTQWTNAVVPVAPQPANDPLDAKIRHHQQSLIWALVSLVLTFMLVATGVLAPWALVLVTLIALVMVPIRLGMMVAARRKKAERKEFFS
jgi:heme O synthase-like polyprenyltransferase